MAPKRPGRAGKALLAAALGLLLAEVVVHVGTDYDAAEQERVFRERVDQLIAADELAEGRDYAFLHPFTGYETQRGAQQVQAQYDVLRGRWESVPVDERPFVVGIVGGSVSLLFGEGEHAGRERLIAELRRDPNLAEREILVLGHGRQGFKQPQQLMLVAWLHGLGFRFDLLINLDGFNEAAYGMRNVAQDVHPSFPAWDLSGFLLERGDLRGDLLEVSAEAEARARETRRFGERVLRSGVLASAVVGRLARGWLDRLSARLWDARERTRARLTEARETRGRHRGPLIDGGRPSREAQAKACVDGWVESSVALAALCAARGTRYLHVLQPTLFDEGSKPLTREELEAVEGDPHLADLARGVRAVYPGLRAAAPRLEARGVVFLDASRLFVDVEQPLYYDHCHFIRAGNELLAERIGEAWRERLAER